MLIPGTCTNVAGSYICSCNTGFEPSGASERLGQRLSCLDVDECDRDQSICGGKGNNCTNTQGSFRCQCLPGFYFVNGTCVQTKEILAYNQVCGNKMAHSVETPNGHVCKCLRTFYKNKGGYCLLGSHVLEFLLHSTRPFSPDLMDESKPSYQQLASATERWANFVMEAVQPYKTSFKRAAADLFEADPITELFTIIHVTLVFDTKHNRDFEIPDSEVLKEIFLDQGDSSQNPNLIQRRPKLAPFDFD
jgi:hypothetical protein